MPTSPSRPSHSSRRPPIRRPQARPAGRPFARLRRFFGRHLTAFRLGAGAVALVAGLSLSPDPSTRPDPQVTEPVAGPDGIDPVLSDSRVAVAIARTASTPELAPGDLVHAIVVTDPLIAGETRPPTIAIRDIVVLAHDEASTTIAVDEAQAPSLVQATLDGSVVLARTNGG